MDMEFKAISFHNWPLIDLQSLLKRIQTNTKVTRSCFHRCTSKSNNNYTLSRILMPILVDLLLSLCFWKKMDSWLVPMLGTQELSWLDKVIYFLCSWQEKLGNYSSFWRPQTIELKVKEKNIEKRRKSSLLQRWAWPPSRTSESMASQPKYSTFHEDIQGLAMSRSIGDNVSKGIGVTHEPELIQLQL